MVWRPPAAHAPARRVDALHPALHEPDAMFAGALEHVHPELLTAEPSAASGMDQGLRIRGEEGEVTPDEGRLGDDVRAGQR
jgi:hypothetical protein